VDTAKDAANTQDTELAEQAGTHHVSLDDYGTLPLYCFKLLSYCQYAKKLQKIN
jgi:hypothetical protein